jgi:hypothetical protein
MGTATVKDDARIGNYDRGSGRPVMFSHESHAGPRPVRGPKVVLHGDDDQIVPIAASALLPSKLIRGATSGDLCGSAARHVHDPEGSRERGVAHLPALIAEPANSPGRT